VRCEMIDNRKNRAPSNNVQPTATYEMNSDTCETPLISSVQNVDGVEFRIVQVGEWKLQALTSDDEPRVRDTDLAERLGFQRTANIRNLIKRLEADGEISGISCRSTVKRQLVNGGSEREYTVNEYWLTESQALMVAIHSKTDAAKKVRKDMVRVCMAARRGLLPQQQAANDQLVAAFERFSLAIVDLQRWREEQVLSIPQMIANAMASMRDDRTGTIGEPKAERSIKSVLRRIARMHEGEGATAQELRSRRGTLENELRNAVEHPMGRAWKWLPVERLAKVEQTLHDMDRLATAIDATRKSERAKLAQGELFEYAVANLPHDEEKKKAN